MRLRALDTFECSGPRCPDSCCRRWHIDLDESTLARWRNAPDSQTGQWLQNSIDYAGDRDPPVLKRCADGGCVHHGADGLCAVQTTLGHEWLPETCQLYPRATVTGADAILETAQLSCPEILALLQRQLARGEAPFDDAPPASEAAPEPEPASELVALQRQLNRYVQWVMDGPGALGVRLYDIAGVLDFLARKAAGGGLSAALMADKAGHKRAAVDRRLERVQRQWEARKLGPNAVMRKRFWATVLAGAEALAGGWPRDCLQAAGVPALLAPNADGRGLQQFIQTARRTLIDQHPGALAFLERYLEVKFRNHGFPWHPFAGNYTVTYLDCVLPYAQCSLLVWAVVARGERLDDETLQRVVYTVEKNVSHNTRIFDFLKRTPWLLQPEGYREALLELG